MISELLVNTMVLLLIFFTFNKIMTKINKGINYFGVTDFIEEN